MFTPTQWGRVRLRFSPEYPAACFLSPGVVALWGGVEFIKVGAGEGGDAWSEDFTHMAML